MLITHFDKNTITVDGGADNLQRGDILSGGHRVASRDGNTICIIQDPLCPIVVGTRIRKIGVCTHCYCSECQEYKL